MKHTRIKISILGFISMFLLNSCTKEENESKQMDRDGTAWVVNAENDNISGIQLGQTWWSGERAQFVCCEDANWGGAILYITRVTTGTAPAYANMFNYNYTYIWNRNWNDVISSYELFQTNLFLSGQQI